MQNRPAVGVISSTHTFMHITCEELVARGSHVNYSVCSIYTVRKWRWVNYYYYYSTTSYCVVVVFDGVRAVRATVVRVFT